MINRSPGRCGFTLLEMLIVVTLIALAAGAVGKTLGTVTGDDAAVRRTLAAFSHTDALARQMARRSGPVSITFDEEGLACLLANGERLGVEPLAGSVDIEIRTLKRSAVLSSYTVDRLGRSDDFKVVVTSGAARGEFILHGLTGWIDTEPNPR